MIVTHWTPADRLRPLQRIENGCQPRIDYANGKYVIRQPGMRMDPSITPGERRFDRAMERVFVASVWVVGIVGGWWAIIEGSKAVYSFAFNHPFGL